jgi:hypothetical protein
MSLNRILAGPIRRPSPALRIVTVLLIAAALGGCGKKGAPQPPAGEPLTYPQPYPSE